MVEAMYPAHKDSWYVLLILFFVAYFLLKANKHKAAKILHMIVRLFYVIMIFSGVIRLTVWNFEITYVVKGILAIVLIYAMEMILVRTKKGTIGTKAPMYWGLFVISLVVVLLLGLRIITF
ncbi:DUF1516 family protein [Halalkalibacter akibai]|uniref:Uncharacterized protein UPF0344 n=1 Tax=Halalkalibacter akibai (strain ATCC 43226 / DSM 21942 / CIP 109018 / JCM 9157 / 1139) TaxID=1236973 RepID=W4QYW1_HALA3|nr:DUF1516 family protein [Halalkalibacter akibai]GAE37335.1 uncharacterized protein UPF0344 [Halalkalibacter akibai JCM 9157]